jgi:predicted RNase H-like HicB family nuclease
MNTTLDKKKFTYWQDGEMWLGYLEDYPDYWTQGESETELRENLLDLYKDLSGGLIPNVRRVAELEIV